MKSYLILLGDRQTEVTGEDLTVKHINYLKDLFDSGNLVTGGPLADDQGILMILKAQSREHAEELIKLDPFVSEDYYQHFVLKEYVEANDDNNWLLEAL